ncbi:DUF1292 domain-containing protein [Clostridium sp. JN-1]|uniref:DUF1292 domain-containing protein n=1 Tax=Clostridium sp. JN-1 TaxID=2483110 RepID=UPI000F0B54DC|nr:DUF1292 domain-containing protein [Clostridium sp. JN-1]
MSKAKEFLENEKNIYGKVYVDINYAIDNVSPFLENNILKQRKYVSKLPILKKYINSIESAENELKNGGFLGRFKEDKIIDLIKDFKGENSESLLQLKKCSECKCLNCSANCKFDSCLGCKDNSKIIECDHRKMNVTKPDMLLIDLTNNRTGENDKYLVLAVLQDVELDKRYIIIQNCTSKEKFILYYYPGISGDDYGEISNPDEFDFIVSTFQSIEEI